MSTRSIQCLSRADKPSHQIQSGRAAGYSVSPTSFDPNPWHIAPAYSGKVVRRARERAFVAGSADGSAPAAVDNFLVVEVIDGALVRRVAASNAEQLLFEGSPIPTVVTGSFTVPTDALDLTALLPADREVTLRVLALDNGVSGSVSDVFVVFEADAVDEPASEERPIERLEGNWMVEWHDAIEPGKSSLAALTLARPWKRTAEGEPLDGRRWHWRRDHEGPWLLSGSYGDGFKDGYSTSTIEISPSGEIRIEHPYFVLGHWGGSSVLTQVSDDEIRGRWTYADKSGVEVWRRVRATLTSAAFDSGGEPKPEHVPLPSGGAPAGRIEKKFDAFWWGPSSMMRGNRPSFRIEVRGENLWGHHVVELEDELDLEQLDHRPVREENVGRPGRIVGLSIELVVWPRCRPGRKTLLIDGNPVVFDLVVEGYPEEETDEGNASLPEFPEVTPKVASMVLVRVEPGSLRSDPTFPDDVVLQRGVRYRAIVTYTTDVGTELPDREITIEAGDRRIVLPLAPVEGEPDTATSSEFTLE